MKGAWTILVTHHRETDERFASAKAATDESTKVVGLVWLLSRLLEDAVKEIEAEERELDVLKRSDA